MMRPGPYGVPCGVVMLCVFGRLLGVNYLLTQRDALYVACGCALGIVGKLITTSAHLRSPCRYRL